MRDCILRGAKIDRERAAMGRQEQLLRVIGVIAGDILNDVGAAVDNVERHPAHIRRRRVRGYRRGDRVADCGVVDGRLLLRLVACGKLLERQEFVVGGIGLRDELRVHRRGIGRACARISGRVPGRDTVIVDRQDDDGRASGVGRERVELRRPVRLGLRHGLAFVFDFSEIERHVWRDIERAHVGRTWAHVADRARVA